MHHHHAACAAAEAACLNACRTGCPLAQLRADTRRARALNARDTAQAAAWATADPDGFAAHIEAEANAAHYYETAHS